MPDINDYLERLAGNAEHQRKYRHHNLFQRRNAKVTQFGVNYTAVLQGEVMPARVYIPITENLITYSKWEMKFIIEPIMKTSNGTIPVTAKNFSFTIEGVDMTPYFKLQYNGYWCHGQGMYPNRGNATYDILRACGYMNEKERDKVLNPGLKRCEMYADGSAQVTISNYIDLNVINK